MDHLHLLSGGREVSFDASFGSDLVLLEGIDEDNVLCIFVHSLLRFFVHKAHRRNNL